MDYNDVSKKKKNGKFAKLVYSENLKNCIVT